ncbi:MAG: hypothetical protein COU09_02600 [Candidatus Harrisonbacteria bacterium CG10_big_fil_rev_8_21_14_0_10_44_23]|uniref:Peptidoglycan binding-like domain-containing protein n=1 Tax=Candidatus Harrisonbacteria bacterium CG10_big_fil_rev_8_21_14_0_10_44_23 TaxID=1974585 RepID=A0A2H0UPQ4_9BACT|nr:MAG: hypothetical protein COU09_02600 [Candidatus Harrisonbacteria bacterium CG10_big_fil_rev_8_21_14_0_10_44_23]
MSTFGKKAAVGFLTFVTTASMAFGPAMSVASAATSAELQAQIDALLGQIAALQAQLGGTSTTTTCTAPAQPLTVGSTGAGVTALQTTLVASGNLVMPLGVAKGYFGPLTQAATAAWQAAHGITPAVGYYGPLTQAAMISACATTSTTTGTGTTTTTTGSTVLSGAAGSVAEYRKSSSYSGEEVGEGEDDVTILGLEIEADYTSDLEILAVKVDFDDAGTANNQTDLDKYVDDVTIWFDGDMVASADSDLFTDDNNYGRTVTLDRGVIIKAGERETLMVAVSGINNLDSASAGDSWQVDLESVRWRDAQSTVISEDPTITETTFTVENFATATDVEFKITGNDDDVNLAHIIQVASTTATDNMDVFSFDVEIKGNSDVDLDDITLEATVTGAGHIDEMFDQAHLYVDGDKVDSVTTPTDDETLTFDDLNLTLEAGETYTFTVAVDFLATNGALDEGDTLLFTIGETQTDLGTTLFDARDEEGNQLADADKTGTASSAASATHVIYIDVALVGTPTIDVLSDGAGGNDDDTVTFSFVMDVTAVGGTLYIADTSAATTSADGALTTVGADGFLYRVYEDGTATADASDLLSCTYNSKVTNSSNNTMMLDGGTTRCTLTITHTNVVTADDGIYHADVAGIGWSISDDDLHEYVYQYNLDAFETTAKYVN